MKTSILLNTRIKLPVLLILLLVMHLILPFSFPKQVQAVGILGATYIRLDRMAASTATTGLVCATPTSTATEAKVTVTFPTGFTVGAYTTWAVATTNIPSGTTAWVSITAPASAGDVSGQSVTFASGDLTATTTYCFRWTSSTALTTSTAGDSKTGSITTKTSGDVSIDSDTYALSVQDDQIAVSASVPQLFTFATGSDITLSTITAGSVAYGSSTVNIATNGANGWIAWVSSANGNLTSSGTSATITSPGSVDNAVSTLASSTYGYVLDTIITTDSSTGTGTVSQASNFGAEYDGGDTCSSSTTGGTLSTSLQPVAASNGTTDGDVLTLCTLVRVNAAQTAASDYADTLTVVAAGRF
jgi:hypothetical protein